MNSSSRTVRRPGDAGHQHLDRGVTGHGNDVRITSLDASETGFPRMERHVERVFRDPQVNFYVQDVEKSVRFYSDLFGFVETFRTPSSGPPEHVEVRLGGLILGLASIEAARRVHGLDVTSGPPRAEVCLWTDDVDRVYSDLVSRGVPSLRAPHDFLGRLRSAWVVDPEGNPVEIVAEIDKSLTSETPGGPATS